MTKKDKYNNFGCLDMTAYLALRNIERKETLERNRNRKRKHPPIRVWRADALHIHV